MNIGEEIVMAYLRYIKKCDFTQSNLYTPDINGEIDVIGIDIKEKKIYVCEVAIHLVTGLRYVNNKRPNNVSKLVDKFSKDIEYAKKYFSDYEIIAMLWSPTVYDRDTIWYCQLNDIKEIKKIINEKYKVELLTIINDEFMNCLEELRDYSKKETKDNKSPIIRFMQIEEYLEKHLKNSPKEQSPQTAETSMN